MSESGASAKKTLLLLALVCVVPVLAGYWVVLGMRPATTTNYGEIVPAVMLDHVHLRQPDGGEFRFADLRGKWILLMVDTGSCDEYCQEKLTYMRQLRLTQGKDRDRVERVWLISDAVPHASALSMRFEGTKEVFAGDSDVLSKLPAARTSSDHIYVVDPLGNLILRFPRHAQPKGMVKDLTRLLRISRIG